MLQSVILTKLLTLSILFSIAVVVAAAAAVVVVVVLVVLGVSS